MEASPRRRVSPTRGFRAPRTGLLTLAPIRDRKSVGLDEGIFPVAYQPWDEFVRNWRWEPGQAVTLVGSTGSGKTTLARHILPRRDYVVVLATKVRDPDLYEPLMEQGFQLVREWNPDPDRYPKIIYAPTLSSPSKEGRAEQAENFRTALTDIFVMGNWTVYMDEVRYLSQYLGLQVELETLWLQGRALGITMFAGTQRPVSVPIIAFDAAHLFLWRTTDQRDIVTASEFTGTLSPTVRHIVPQLPIHEVLYVNTRSGEIVRTKANLSK